MHDEKPAVGQDMREPRAQYLLIPVRETGLVHDIVEALFVAGPVGAQRVADRHMHGGRRVEETLGPDHLQLFFGSCGAHVDYPLIPVITIPCKKVRWVTKKKMIGTSVDTAVIAIKQ